MITNYLKLTIRLLLRNPFFTMINLFGLSLGFAVFFILWQHARNELRGEMFLKNYDRIYRLAWTLTATSNNEYFTDNFGGNDAAVEKVISEIHPELADHVRVCPQNSIRSFFTGDHDKEIVFARQLLNGDKISFSEEHVAYADPNLFDFFGIPLVSGDANSVLKDPASLALSEKLAHKYFGTEDPLGKTIMLNETIPLRVTGVFADLPGNTHLDFDAVMSLVRVQRNISAIDLSREAFFRMYVKLDAGVNQSALLQRVKETNLTLLKPQLARWNLSWDYTPYFQPLRNMVFETVRQDSFTVKSKDLISIFEWIAIIVLLLGWINYINFSISSHRKRVKEIGARVALGARPVQFITQFVIEASVINAVAILLAITFIQLLKVPLEESLHFSYPDWTALDRQSWLVLCAVLVAGFFICGFYPAMIAITQGSNSFLSKFKLTNSENIVARSLTIAQFLIAATLIVWVFTVNEQMTYISSRNIGLRKDNVMVVNLPFPRARSWASETETFCNGLLQIPGISDYASSSSVAGDFDPNGIGLQRTLTSPFLGVATNGGIDDRFIPFYNIKVITGRNFIAGHPADEEAVIISKIALDRLGIPLNEALGKEILVERSAWTHHMVPATIIGVIEDYKHQPLLRRAKGYWGNDLGMVLTRGNTVDRENVAKKISIRLDVTEFSRTLSAIQKLYLKAFDGHVFHWSFLDENINRHYRNEMMARNQIFIFTFIAICIASLGLLGMISNKIIERTKEIGIRKVMGAGLQHIASLLINTTLKQAVIAIILGIPLAWLLTEQYLEKFSERISLAWWHFAIPASLFIIILLFTVASVVWKAARSNPVDSLRYE